MMKLNEALPVLFVNVDGVLTSARTYWVKQEGNGRHESKVIDKAALSILAMFCERTNAQVVMASAWSAFMMKSPVAWRLFFEELGYPLPVVDMLPVPREGRTWADEMDGFMAAYPDTPHVLFEDDPALQNHPRVIPVDAQVALSTVDLQKAAELLEPGSELAKELGSLNKSFSCEATMAISFNGQSVEVHPRDLAKGLDALGVSR